MTTEQLLEECPIEDRPRALNNKLHGKLKALQQIAA